MQSIELIQAESKAADLCLTILTDAGLIGENLVTKLRAAQQAILACLPKMYAACNAVEKETGKNMYRVAEVVVQMFSRAKWADHDAMMTRVEALLVAFVEEAKAEAAPAELGAVAEIEVQIQAAKEEATEAPVMAVVYFKGNEKGDKGPAVGLKHVTQTEDINTALGEALDQFEVVGPVRVFINDVEVSGLFANSVLSEIRRERKAKADADGIESLLKAEAIDFLNEAAAVAALPAHLLAPYQEELAKRRQEAFGLRVGQNVETPVGPAVVESFDRHVVGEVKIRFPGNRGATTTHYSKLLPC